MRIQRQSKPSKQKDPKQRLVVGIIAFIALGLLLLVNNLGEVSYGDTLSLAESLIQSKRHRQTSSQQWNEGVTENTVKAAAGGSLRKETSSQTIKQEVAVIKEDLNILENVLSKSSDPNNEGPPSSHSSTASTKKSLHPKWKLWQEMNESEQEEALDRVGEYLRKYGKLIMTPAEGDKGIQSSKRGSCEFEMFGGQSGHALCLPKPEKKV
jgi:hypothetical protein